MWCDQHEWLQVAQAVPTQQQAGWHGEIGAQAQRRFLVPAAASMRGAGHAVREAAARAATATEHQAQETGHWIKSLVGAATAAACAGPQLQRHCWYLAWGSRSARGTQHAELLWNCDKRLADISKYSFYLVAGWYNLLLDILWMLCGQNSIRGCKPSGVALRMQGRGGAEPIAAMPAPRAADLRHRGHPVIVGVEPQSRGTVEHIQETLQSPAVRVVGARPPMQPVLWSGAACMAQDRVIAWWSCQAFCALRAEDYGVVLPAAALLLVGTPPRFLTGHCWACVQ